MEPDLAEKSPRQGFSHHLFIKSVMLIPFYQSKSIRAFRFQILNLFLGSNSDLSKKSSTYWQIFGARFRVKVNLIITLFDFYVCFFLQQIVRHSYDRYAAAFFCLQINTTFSAAPFHGTSLLHINLFLNILKSPF